MHSFTAAAVLGLAATTLALPTNNAKPGMKQLPLADGFPNPSPQQLDQIEDNAFGTLSNAAPPPTLSDDTLTSVRLVAFGETIESVFFEELITNITLNLPGYDRIPNRDFTLRTLKSMLATEELHALNAQNALKHFGKDQIQPCQYKFPVSSFDEAITFISTTTDFVQGVLGDIINKAASANDAGFTRGVAGALSNEGEQDGWFRFILGQRPNQKPFNTISTREYAFSKLQDLVVPGSCPNANEIDLPVFQPLNANNPPAKTVDIDFTFSLRPVRAAPGKTNSVQSFATSNVNDFAHKYQNNWSGLTISYLNGQDAPITQKLKSLRIEGDEVTVVAEFPFDEFKMFGLSVAALTVGDNFANQDEMVKATLFGPALLEAQEGPF